MAKARTSQRNKPEQIDARARKKIETLLPASFRSHLKASIREGLLAFESLLDEAVKTLEDKGRKGPVRKSRKIKVE